MHECPVREELLVKYIDAGNEVIDRRKRLEVREASCDRELASVMMQRALRERIRFSRSLRRHLKEHGC